ncbi:MAG: hypothetical protein QG650_155 [Patescibacteria group bacterium]|nr:hypothetical protein [Patescibacteria group bacterium]
MSIDANAGNYPGRTDSIDGELDKIVQGVPSEQEIAEARERLDAALETLKAEFVFVARAVELLETVKLDEANFPKIAFIGDRIAALAEISPELAKHPDIRKNFDNAVLYVTNAFLRVFGKKCSESESPKVWLERYSDIRGKLERSIRSLGLSQK